MIGKTAHELGVWTDPASRARIVADIKKEGSVRNFEIDVRLSSGKVISMLFSATTLEIDGEMCMLSAALDITERRQNEERLRLKRFIIDHARDAFYLMGPDARFVYVNESACESLGYTNQELLELTVFDIDPEFPREAWSERWAELKRRKGLVQESIRRRKDGSTFPVEVAVNHLELDSGEYSCAFARDITERKLAEEELRESKERYRGLSEAAVEGLAIHEKGIILEANNALARMFGYEPSEVIGMNALDMTAPECREMLLNNILKGYEEPYEATGLKKDGSKFPVVLTGKNIKHKGREVRVTAITDLTERKLAEEEKLNLERQIQQAQKMESLGVLAGGIAHDFNNLLMGVLGNAEVALLELKYDSIVRSRLQDIQTAGLRLTELTNQMLVYSGKGNFIVESLYLSSLIEEIIQLLKMSVPKNVNLDLQLDSNLPTIKGDSSQIRQVVMNLITNAAEACEDRNGSISIITGVQYFDRSALSEYLLFEETPEDDYVYLEVSDTGCGMDDTTCQKIFEPFFTTKFTGRGLGMAAVMGILRSHKGAIQVCSEPEQGTIVKILFPFEKGKKIEGAQNSNLDEEQTTYNDGLVLLVDDEETVLSIGRTMLERLGHDVITAADGLEAVKKVRENGESLVCVLLDLTMPRMDGIEAFSEIRRIRADLPVVICSGYSLQEANSQFARMGLKDFLQKPYRFQQLVRKLEELLG